MPGRPAFTIAPEPGNHEHTEAIFMHSVNTPMKTIVDLKIEPAEKTCVTPLELLEDFANSQSLWYFLEEESRFYSEMKHVPACIIRFSDYSYKNDVDFAFAATQPDEYSSFRLLLVDSEDYEEPIDEETRDRVVSRFVTDFNAYLGSHSPLVKLCAVEKDQ